MGTYIGLGSITHQWTDIGESAMIGLQAAVTKHVPPFCTITGVPAKILKLNRTGLERRGFTAEILDEVENNFKAIIMGDYDSQNEMVVKIREFMAQYPESLKSFIYDNSDKTTLTLRKSETIRRIKVQDLHIKYNLNN